MKETTAPDGLVFAAGEIIFLAGARGDSAYIILEGSVEIFVDSAKGRQVLAVLGPQSCFGEMALLGQPLRAASARAVSPTRLTALSRDYLEQSLLRADPLHRHLLRLTVQRLQASFGLQATVNSDEDSRIAQKQLRLAQGLRRGMSDGSLRMDMQPIVRLADEQRVGYESLMRFESPELGRVPPSEFIPLAERDGLVVELGRWTVDTVCRLLAPLTGGAPLFVNINVSPAQFNDDSFLEHLQAGIRLTGLPPQQLHVEVTEATVMADLGRSLAFLEGCRAMGVQIMLDDFGTGYSAMSYLHRLPIDGIKLDRSFIESAEHNAAARKVVAAVTRLAGELSIETVAEGIETAAQAAFCRNIGVGLGQGYLFGKPDRWQHYAATASAIPISRA